MPVMFFGRSEVNTVQMYAITKIHWSAQTFCVPVRGQLTGEGLVEFHVTLVPRNLE